jgi:hypothetical protein
MKPDGRFRVAGLLALAGWSDLVYSGCDAGEEAPAAVGIQADGPKRTAAYERDILAIKAAIQDPMTREKAIRETVARHGFPLPAEAEAEAPAGKEAFPSLAKAAASSQYIEMKNISGNVSKTLQYSKSLSPGERLTATAEGNGATDPALVAYYLEGGTSEARPIKVVGVREDGFQTLNPSLEWTNNTGVSRSVIVIVFAESDATRGTAKVVIRNEDRNQGNYWSAAPVGGSLQTTHTVSGITLNPGCGPSPVGSTIWGRITNGSTYSAQVLAASMTYQGIRMTVKESGNTMETVPITGKFSNYPHLDSGFVLVYNPMTSTVPEQAAFNVTQTDRYDCSP